MGEEIAAIAVELGRDFIAIIALRTSFLANVNPKDVRDWEISATIEICTAPRLEHFYTNDKSYPFVVSFIFFHPTLRCYKLCTVYVYYMFGYSLSSNPEVRLQRFTSCNPQRLPDIAGVETTFNANFEAFWSRLRRANLRLTWLKDLILVPSFMTFLFLAVTGISARCWKDVVEESAEHIGRGWQGQTGQISRDQQTCSKRAANVGHSET